MTGMKGAPVDVPPLFRCEGGSLLPPHDDDDYDDVDGNCDDGDEDDD